MRLVDENANDAHGVTLSEQAKSRLRYPGLETDLKSRSASNAGDTGRDDRALFLT